MSALERCLFVGGIANGSVRGVREKMARVDVVEAVTIGAAYVHLHTRSPVVQSLRRESYDRHAFQFGHREIAIYAPIGWTAADAFEHIIRVYAELQGPQ